MGKSGKRSRMCPTSPASLPQPTSGSQARPRRTRCASKSYKEMSDEEWEEDWKDEIQDGVRRDICFKPGYPTLFKPEQAFHSLPAVTTGATASFWKACGDPLVRVCNQKKSCTMYKLSGSL